MMERVLEARALDSVYSQSVIHRPTTTIPRESVKNANSWAHSRLTDSKSLGAGPRNLCLTSSLGDSHAN